MSTLELGFETRGKRPLFSGPIEWDCNIATIDQGCRFSVRLHKSDAALLPPHDYLKLAIPVNTFSNEGSIRCSRMSPDEWQVVGPLPIKNKIAKELSELVGGLFSSIVDIDQRDVELALSGPMARELISAGCPLDLSSDAFPSGSVARSVYGAIGITVLNTGDGFILECMRSFVPYLKVFMQTIVGGTP